MEILFLPPIYLLVILASGIVTGLTFDYIIQKPFITASATLFVIFSVGQIVFRYLLNEEPGRLIGQIIYFLGFLAIVYLTRIIKERLFST